jgi:hypothetical protein
MIWDKRRMMLRVWAQCAARQIVKDDLKRRNMKPSRYAMREISIMAEQYLAAGNWERLEAEAFGRIMACPKLRAQYEAEGLKYEKAMARRKKAA